MASGKRDENREVVAMAETNNAARTPTPLQVDPTTKRLLVDISGLDATYVNVTGDTMTGLLQFSGTDHAGIQLINLTTAQRDALTPSEGMIIYNSTLDKVQKYENSTWVDVGMSPATKVVATSASGYAADYYTDGTADNVQIQAALDAINTAGGGTLYLKAGTYSLSVAVNIYTDIKIKGDGARVTILQQGTTNAHGFRGTGTMRYITFEDLQLLGTGEGVGTGDAIFIGDGAGATTAQPHLLFKNVYVKDWGNDGFHLSYTFNTI